MIAHLLQVAEDHDTQLIADRSFACNNEDEQMPDDTLPIDGSEFRRRALSRWDTDGGATASIPNDAHQEVRPMSNTELVLLRIRVIALENLMIAVLSEGSDRQRELAREMAGYIAPQLGHTQHPLTVQASHHMTDLVDRALHFCSKGR